MTVENVSGFTPGPWQRDGSFGVTVLEWDGEPARTVAMTLPNARVGSDESLRQAEANARLIAASPELFEALEEAYRFITQPTRMDTPSGGPKTATYRTENYNALTTKLRAVLAKARGRA